MVPGTASAYQHAQHPTLGASNYTLQVLNAPLRLESDHVHARGDWFDVGITSLQKVTRIDSSPRVLWILLGMSSASVQFPILRNSGL